MKKQRWLLRGLIIFSVMVVAVAAYAAYHHGGDTDSGVFLGVYPDTAGTKLDNCAVCHTGGESKPGVWMGSCQWCHFKCGYAEECADINLTLNGYGMDYRDHGRNADALNAIANLDSDGDGYSNADEIAARRYPGEAKDDPSKVQAASRVFTLEELEGMPQHAQFLLMNTSKSGDFYAEYAGVPVEDLLQEAAILSSATGIHVYAPDGFSQYHPLDPDPNPALYHVFGPYPEAGYYYNGEADQDITPYGWCDYSAPSCLGRVHGDPIHNEGGNRMLLAVTRDGSYLQPGELNPSNKLDGEGPYRIVPPQKLPGPPDQSSTSGQQLVIWPYDRNADHNAGAASRSATIIKVEPLPAGTTDIDTLEAGWNFVDEKKIVVYGAIDPVPTIISKMAGLTGMIKDLDNKVFKKPAPVLKLALVVECLVIKTLIQEGLYKPALKLLENGIMNKADGCIEGDAPDRNDWIRDCSAQKQIYWAANEVIVLLKTIE